MVTQGGVNPRRAGQATAERGRPPQSGVNPRRFAYFNLQPNILAHIYDDRHIFEPKYC